MDFINFNIIDLVDIVLVAIIIWQIFKALRGTAAMTIFLAIILLYVIWIIVNIMNMKLMGTIMSQILGVGMLALIVVFQQEVRHYLLILGNRISKSSNKFLKPFINSKTINISQKDILEIVNAAMDMSRNKVGALIVFQRTADLSTVKQSGDFIDAEISSRLIETIFFKNTPLHDGAMIISEGKIKYSRCILPVSDNLAIPARLGLRHRAASGITEQTDSFALVVSEQTGGVSIVDKGVIRTLGPGDNLSEILSEKMTL